MIPTGSQPSQAHAGPLAGVGPSTGSQPSQAHAGPLAGVGPPTGSQPSQAQAGPLTGPETPDPPLLAVVKGEPTPEELAALTAVVLSLGQTQQAAPEGPGVRHWVRRQQLRLAPRPGPQAWRRSLG
ncbi:Acyl-CoA carboxylase epsilon subunit [Arthrobacter sp. 49Tsu3.1M3]|nr:Acyl-CoA carboxylase epsilon subunit [Arthrobacter sp. 49Tsu3.1M3]